MSVAYGRNVDLILAILKDAGKMGSTDLQVECGLDRKTFSKTMRTLVLKSEEFGQRAHIIGWDREPDGNGMRCYPRPTYKFGPGKNVPRPPRDDHRTKREWWARQKERLLAANPFVKHSSTLMRRNWKPKKERECHTPTTP